MPEAQLAVTNQNNALAVEQALVKGDLAGLNVAQRLDYYKQVCESLGLNPLTKPFGYHEFDGKTVLYARKDCTEQLRKIHGVSVTKLENEVKEGLIIYTAYVSDKEGRTDVGTGAVSIEGEKGKNRANAIMKAETKAKRRATLSLCGLGVLDESELDSLPEIQQVTALETKALPEAVTAPSAVNSAPASSSVSEQSQAELEPLPDSPLIAFGGIKTDDPAPQASEPAPTGAKPSDVQFLAYKSRASNLRAELEKNGFKASPGQPTGQKLVKYFLLSAGAAKLEELTINQWETIFSLLDNLVRTDAKKAVEIIEEKIK